MKAYSLFRVSFCDVFKITMSDSGSGDEEPPRKVKVLVAKSKRRRAVPSGESKDPLKKSTLPIPEGKILENFVSKEIYCDKFGICC